MYREHPLVVEWSLSATECDDRDTGSAPVTERTAAAPAGEPPEWGQSAEGRHPGLSTSSSRAPTSAHRFRLGGQPVGSMKVSDLETRLTTFDAVQDATQRLLSINEAADGRELTNAQQRDFAEASARLVDNLDEAFADDDSLYARRLRENVENAVNTNTATPEAMAAYAGALSGLVKMARSRAINPDGWARADALSRAGDRPRTGADGARIRDLFVRARDGGFGGFDSYASENLFDTRALSGNVGTAIPTTFADFVTVYERTYSPMFDPRVVTVLGRTSGAPLVLPRVTADPVHGGTVTAEAAAINELDPTISQVTLNPYKYAIINLWSSELADDNTIGLEELLARTTGRELGLDIGAHMTTGDGSGKPQGWVGVATNGGTASGTATWGASATFFGWGDLVSLYGAVAAPYRGVGSWMVSSDAFTKILQFRDNNNQPILIPGMGGAPATLLGRPVYENPAMASVGSASKSVAFGDFSRYVVAKVTPTRVEVSRDYKFSTDQLAMRTVERVDGDLVDAAAVAYLVSANT